MLASIIVVALACPASGSLLAAASAPVPAPAPAPAGPAGSLLVPCPPTVIEVTQDQLLNHTDAYPSPDSPVCLFSRGRPFGFWWVDATPSSCSIQSVDIMLLGGKSCSGAVSDNTGVGGTSLNGRPLPANYSFPYDMLQQSACSGDCQTSNSSSCNSCPTSFMAPQVFSVDSLGSYFQGGNNSFSITSLRGTNGLASLDRAGVSNRSGVYAEIIINQWAPAGGMNTARTAFGYELTPLNNTLAVGGISSSGKVLGTGEVYYAFNRSWVPTANNLTVPVAYNQVAKLSSISDLSRSIAPTQFFLLSAGGVDEFNSTRAEAQLYSTASNQWSTVDTPNMRSGRAFFQLTPILQGSSKALATGGVQGRNGSWVVLNTTEMYNRDEAAWTALADMATARHRHAAVKTDSTTVMVIGGKDGSGNAIASAESLSFNNTWESSGLMNQARYDHTAITLDNSSVIVIGGASRLPNGTEIALSSCELWSTNNTWTSIANLTYPRFGHRAVLLGGGRVMVAGGTNGLQPVGTAEVWNPSSGTWIPVGTQPTPLLQFGLVALSSNRTFAFGGNAAGQPQNGTSSTVTFQSAVPMSSVNTSAILLPAQLPPLPPAPAPVITVAPSSDDSKLSTGAVIGIVLGGAAGTAVLVLACVFGIRWWKRRPAQKGQLTDPKLPDPPGVPQHSVHSSSVDKGGHSVVLRKELNCAMPSALLGKLAGCFREEAVRDLPASQSTEGSVVLPMAKSTPFSAPDPISHGSNGSGTKSIRPLAAQAAALEVRSPFADITSSHENNSLHTPPGQARSQSALGAGGVGGAAARNSASRNAGASSDEDRFDSAPPMPNQASWQSSAREPVRSGGQSDGSRRSDLSRFSLLSARRGSSISQPECRLLRESLQYEEASLIGRGGFGQVYEGKYLGSRVAIKKLELRGDKAIEAAEAEFAIMHELRHTHLVLSYGACIDGNMMLLVMELMEESLFHAIAREQTTQPDSPQWFRRGWKIAQDVALALVYLHSKGVVHLDVKSLNILLKNERREAKLGDLGLARMVPAGHLSLQQTLPGTPAYSAPEVVRAQHEWRLRTQGATDVLQTEVGMPADIYAFAVVLCEICIGCHPDSWHNEFRGELRRDQGPPELAALINDCKAIEPAQRPTASQVHARLVACAPRNGRD